MEIKEDTVVKIGFRKWRGYVMLPSGSAVFGNAKSKRGARKRQKELRAMLERNKAMRERKKKEAEA